MTFSTAANGKLGTHVSDSCAARDLDVISSDPSDALVQDLNVELSEVGRGAGHRHLLCPRGSQRRQYGSGGSKQNNCFSLFF